ncbi:MAG: ThiF family adenylyltransferase [Candidatus Melainabacteria bacterium]|nr:MAG: ThiF family adenylyltransferase [Candidatus Melainabacteria bacterium]
MTRKLFHEQLHRGTGSMEKLASFRIVICGAGALGSNLAVNLARMGVANLAVIDKDRVEMHNIGTQVYGLDDVGGLKSDALRNLIHREVGDEIISISKELTAKNVTKLLRGFDLIVDAFDNSNSRRLVYEEAQRAGTACLHAGLNGSYGQVQWNDVYVVPGDANDHVCDYPLARNLIVMLVALTSEASVRYCLEGKKLNLSVTLEDLSVNIDEC